MPVLHDKVQNFKYMYIPPIHLHLIFEISSSENWFLNLIFEIDFLSISNLIFTACVACTNPVRNRQKIKFKNQVQKLISWTRDLRIKSRRKFFYVKLVFRSKIIVQYPLSKQVKLVFIHIWVLLVLNIGQILSFTLAQFVRNL